METVQLQCGHCKKVMAISAAHLGQQVQCPHCKGVVQTPLPQSAAAQPVAPAPDATVGPTPATEPPSPAAPASAPGSMFHDAPVDTTTTATGPAPNTESEFPQFKPKPRKDSSVLLIIALIFLVPYALTMTFFVIFLVMKGAGQSDGLEYLRDPVPGPAKGGPRQVRKQPPHDSKIAAHRKTTLGKPVQAGDLQVTPLRVVLTPGNHLKLVMRAKNTSAKTAFEPMHDSYVNEAKSTVPPYTFLESRSSNLTPIYGGYLAYFKEVEPKGDPVSFPLLSPREEITIVLETDNRYREKHVAEIAKASNGEYTWRVQVRRGFVDVDRKQVSATTVIGVDFTSKDIEREKT